MQSQKQKNDLCSFPRQTIQYHSNPSLCPTSNTEETEIEWFYEDLQDLLELPPKKDVLFIIGDWNAKVGSQEISGLTCKFDLGVQNEAGQRLRVLPRATREAHVYTKMFSKLIANLALSVMVETY